MGYDRSWSSHARSNRVLLRRQNPRSQQETVDLWEIALPAFEDLPLRPGDPPYSAWGLWEKPELGTLNYLPDGNVLRTAREEIQTGRRIGLNLALDVIDPPLFGRRPFSRRLFVVEPGHINDDEITLNTQGSSQWDSLRHYAYPKEAKFYNGVTQDDIHGTEDATVNSMQAWASSGIAGRGILIDYHRWTQQNAVPYDPLKQHAIPVAAIKAIIEECKIEVRKGDIFFLHTGFVEAYSTLDKEARQSYSSTESFPGLGQSKEMVEWLWQQQFSAVAGDNPALECLPFDPAFGLLHPIILAGWGTPIGELFKLDELAKQCKQQGRWTFFVTSSPLNYTGAAGSPPNAMAIF